MLIVPLQSVSNQTLSVQLGTQRCRINLYQRYEFNPNPVPAMYLDILVNDSAILVGQICRDRVRLVRDAYLGFVGDLAFFDQTGIDDPLGSGLGDRWQLVYLEAGE